MFLITVVCAANRRRLRKRFFFLSITNLVDWIRRILFCHRCEARNLPFHHCSLNVEKIHLFIPIAVEEKHGGPSWIHMMDKSTPTMAYQASQRDVELDCFR